MYTAEAAVQQIEFKNPRCISVSKLDPGTAWYQNLALEITYMVMYY